MLKFGIIVAAFLSFGSAMASQETVLCAAEGKGIWNQKSADLYYSISLVNGTQGEAVLYVNENPAAEFALTNVQGKWTGTAANNPSLKISVDAVAGGTAQVLLNDWKNDNSVALGFCDASVRN